MTTLRTTLDVEFLPATLTPPQRRTMVRLDLAWHRKHPFTVAATFHYPGEPPAPWGISSELLAEGLLYPAGEGDVFVCVDPADRKSLLLVLDSGQGRCGFRLPVEFMGDFLTRIGTALQGRVPWERIQ